MEADVTTGKEEANHFPPLLHPLPFILFSLLYHNVKHIVERKHALNLESLRSGMKRANGREEIVGREGGPRGRSQ